jgi:surface protein
MFYKCSSLKSLTNFSKWNTKNITNMSYMFDKSMVLKSSPVIPKWYAKNAKNIIYKFYY